MIDYKAIEIVLKTWIKSVTDLGNANVISQNDNHGRPTTQYATIKVYDGVVIGHDTYTTTNAPLDTVDLNYSGVRKIMVSVNIYKDDTVSAMEQMAKLVSSFNRLDTQMVFTSAKIGIINSSEIRDLTSLVDNNYEERRQADFFIYANDNDVINVEAIMRIAGNGFGVDYTVN